MKGGFWETLTNVWEKTKQTASDAYGSVTGAPSTQSSTYVPSSTYGGKKRRMSRRKMRGGYADNISLNNLAANAAPFTGNTAQPHTWVGGRTRRNKRKRSHRNKRSHRRR
jgi:hypothetical protein